MAPKKCFFLRRSVKFLGHIVDEYWVSTDTVAIITNMTSVDLKEPDGVTPSQKRIIFFLGMVNYYQHFVPRYYAIAKPLVDMLKVEKRGVKKHKNKQSSRKLSVGVPGFEMVNLQQVQSLAERPQVHSLDTQ